MSIYRRFDPYPGSRNDVFADTTVQGKTRRSTTPRKSVESEDPKHLRKAVPATTLLPYTFKWLASLPPNVRPTALPRQYARIANLIAAAWRDPKSFETYMDSLLTDKRENRRGFPPEVLRELISLRRYYDLRGTDTSVWETVRKRG